MPSATEPGRTFCQLMVGALQCTSTATINKPIPSARRHSPISRHAKRWRPWAIAKKGTFDVAGAKAHHACPCLRAFLASRVGATARPSTATLPNARTPDTCAVKMTCTTANRPSPKECVAGHAQHALDYVGAFKQAFRAYDHWIWRRQSCHHQHDCKQDYR